MMTPKERAELAADIAKRVRLFAWKGVSDATVQAFGTYAWNFRQQMPGDWRTAGSVYFRYTAQPPRLEIEFQSVNGETTDRFLFTQEKESE